VFQHFKLETIDVIASFKDVGKPNSLFLNHLKSSFLYVFNQRQLTEEQKEQQLMPLRWVLENSEFSSSQ
jgi:hypothetical protein